MNQAVPMNMNLKSLDHAMSEATSYSDWFELARQHDALSQADIWRETNRTNLYDYVEIQTRRDKLKKYLDEGANRELLYALNEGVHGNMGGMGKPILYNRAKCGTKHLIDDYVSVICQSLLRISEVPESEISYLEKLDFFRRASHCYGRSALLLSGGAGLIYFHHGVVQELVNHDLVPNVLSGASAGAVVSGQLGIYTNDELKNNNYFSSKRYEQYAENSLLDSLLGRITEKEAKLHKEQALDEIVPMDLTFQEAYEKTGRYINVSISPAEKHQNSRLMNAITSPNVYVRSAISASCSIPGMIPAERLYAKGYDGKPRPYLASRRWVDGSVSGDLPARRLARLYGVNHFIVSLINPVVVPFIDDVKSRQRKGFKNALSASGLNMTSEVLSFAEKMLERWGRVGQLAGAQVAYIKEMLDQSYLGDINILLQKKDFKWRHTLFEFNEGEEEKLVQAGRRNVYPKIAMIQNAAMISKTLDGILEELAMEGLPQTTVKHHVYA
ncbi:patatin-like phospholipase family protein [Alcanivorax sp. S6407]|uniref:patatin-like phospholipase family protein n=1 Tax=Alcanivorax sp. S6407 TaxID=2926424 RepID=UPI001FF2E17A|nr:patatin-like phospholipase family protein [Alcanivorax sp. S6407]MCK0154822.1 patatin-like phospholipase family protein [Alcanivorax sp. S6407]